MGPDRAILVCGPTAGGKSSFAVALAGAVGGVIINADSMQLYADLRLLTARPSPTQEGRVPHRLYGVVSGDQRFSVGLWLERAATEIATARAQGQVPILVGGTGLYFKALVEGLAEIPEIPPEVRARWAAVAREGGTAQLASDLRQIDPQMAALLEPGDRQRLVRALEVKTATGRSLAEWQKGRATPVLDLRQTTPLVLAPPRPTIHARIGQRVETMLQEGAIDEVAALLELRLDPGLPVMKAIGVAEIARLIEGKADLATTATDMATSTRRYAKRQGTWARKYMADWRWIERVEDDLVAQIAATIVA